MANEFVENNKFFSLEGTINRRTYITNYMIVEIVAALIFSTPFFYLLIFNQDILAQILKFSTHQGGGYLRWMLIWSVIACIIEVGLLFPSKVKRIRDITGNEDNTFLIVLAVISPILAVAALPFVSQFFWGLAFFITICLMIMKGKITGEKPKDEIIRFNWGAMLGTWIWGIFNKSYWTLLAIPLFFTTGFFPFMLVCGLKGNEWAYKKSEKSVEDFHKSQSTQSTIFAVLMPIIFLAGSLIFFISGSIAVGKYMQNHPNALKKFEKYSEQIIKTNVESSFSKIELTKDEYKFYINPEVWSKLPSGSKLNLFHVTENYVIMSQSKDFTKNTAEYVNEYNKIKIHSTFNNELLAECYFDENEYKILREKLLKGEISIKEYINKINSAYKFNDNPTLP